MDRLLLLFTLSSVCASYFHPVSEISHSTSLFPTETLQLLYNFGGSENFVEQVNTERLKAKRHED